MNIYTIPRLPKIIWNASSFLARNFIVSRQLPVFHSSCVCEKYNVIPCTLELIPDVVGLSVVLEHTVKIDILKKFLLKL